MWDVEFTEHFGKWWATIPFSTVNIWKDYPRRITMARSWQELRDQMSPEQLQASEERATSILTAMRLNELRGARGLTQEELAGRLDVAQSNVSRLEHRADMRVSTLREVVQALGGELRLVAEFSDGSVEIETLAVCGSPR